MGLPSVQQDADDALYSVGRYQLLIIVLLLLRLSRIKYLRYLLLPHLSSHQPTTRHTWRLSHHSEFHLTPLNNQRFTCSDSHLITARICTSNLDFSHALSVVVHKSKVIETGAGPAKKQLTRLILHLA